VKHFRVDVAKVLEIPKGYSQDYAFHNLRFFNNDKSVSFNGKKEFDVIQDSKVNGYIYVGVTAKGKNNQQYLCLLDEKTIRTTSYETDEIISDVNDGLNVQVLIKPLEKLENNGITPYLITSVIIDGIKG
jgi:hypothetical protein